MQKIVLHLLTIIQILIVVMMIYITLMMLLLLILVMTAFWFPDAFQYLVEGILSIIRR